MFFNTEHRCFTMIVTCIGMLRYTYIHIGCLHMTHNNRDYDACYCYRVPTDSRQNPSTFLHSP